MLARVTEPGIVPSLPALHHRCAVECRRRLASPARGDSGTRRPADFRRHELSQTGHALGRRGAPVLRGAGQDRQLSGGRHRGVVDGRPRPICSGPRCICPTAWVTDAGARAGAHSRHGRVSRKMAPGADAAAAGPGERVHRHGRAGRCGIWRQSRVSRHVASAAAALRAWGSRRTSRSFSERPRLQTARPAHARGRPRKHPTLADGRHGAPARRGDRGGRGPLAPHALAQSARGAAMDGGVRGDPRHAGGRLPAPSARPRNLAPGRARCRRHAAHQILFRPSAADRVADRRSSAWRINAGRSSSNIKTSRPSSASIISKGARSPGGITMSCSPRSRTTSCKPSDSAPESA